MEVNKVLEMVEKQRSERELAGKMFRYTGLILAVDFFSQKLTAGQIIDSAFDFVNELLSLDNSAIYSACEDGYELKREKIPGTYIEKIPANEYLQNLASFRSGLLTGNELLSQYLGTSDIDVCGLRIMMPITVDNKLEGFVLISARSSGVEFDEDDSIICEVLMKLINSSMENFRRYHELQEKNSSLDEKVFNLFAINQSSKALLSELDLDMLYSLSIDVFSELTQSSSTGFFLYDEKSEGYSLMSCKFVTGNMRGSKPELFLSIDPSATVQPGRVIINFADKNDLDYFNSLFPHGIDTLNPLSPVYLVLLEKDRSILGFVTLGATVFSGGYRNSLFELVESLASSTYISITNAKHFKQVGNQKQLIQEKLERLISLNGLVRNINNSNSLEALVDVTLKTL
ncbi:MAG: hypothetical protein HGA22_13570, partial [Clostridiales bacterium]|nr:hypothetical protein [Clostridiales bacterium]